MRRFLLAAALIAPSLGLGLTPSAIAQTITEAQMRAANLARMQAELINGGLGRYTPADCMHQGGGGSCLVSRTAQGFRFRFMGGPPGWTTNMQPATIESDVFVSEDGKTIRMDYNGPIRPKP
jgi:hypothetical protein